MIRKCWKFRKISIKNSFSTNEKNSQQNVEMPLATFLTQLKQELQASQTKSEERMQVSHKELKQDLQASQKEMKQDLQASQKEMKQELQASHKELKEGFERSLKSNFWKLVVYLSGACFGGMSLFYAIGGEVIPPWLNPKPLNNVK